MGKWTFIGCDEHEQDALKLAFDNRQERQVIKSRIGCECPGDTLEYHAQSVGPLNAKYFITVKCGSCGKKVNIDYNPSPINL